MKCGCLYRSLEKKGANISKKKKKRSATSPTTATTTTSSVVVVVVVVVGVWTGNLSCEDKCNDRRAGTELNAVIVCDM